MCRQRILPSARSIPEIAEANGTTSSPDQTYVGTVSLAAVVSDKGYVCSARVLQGIDKKTDAEALAKVKEWRFNPAQKDGQAVPVSIQVDVSFWRDKNGDIVSSPSNPAEEQTKVAKPERSEVTK